MRGFQNGGFAHLRLKSDTPTKGDKTMRNEIEKAYFTLGFKKYDKALMRANKDGVKVDSMTQNQDGTYTITINAVSRVVKNATDLDVAFSELLVKWM